MNEAIKFDFLNQQLSSNKKSVKSGSLGTYSNQNSGTKESASNLFMVKFNQLLNKNGIRNNNLSNDLDLTKITNTTLSSSSKVDVSSESVKNELLKGINSSQGFEFITKLKQYVMASGHDDLKNISIGNDGLEAVKVMLSKAGFPNSKVNELIEKLKSESDDGKVFVSDLMDGLLGLDLENLSAEDFSTDGDVLSIDKKSDKNDKDLANSDLNGSQILDMSSIPFISSIMKSLGVSDDLVNSIIADSEVKGEGLSLNSLVSELQSVQKTSFFTGKSFQNSSDVQSIKEMLSQIGISEKNSEVQKIGENGSITLANFVSALEQLREQNLSNKSEAAINSNGNGKIAIPQNMISQENEDGSIAELNQIKKSSSAAINDKIISKTETEVKKDNTSQSDILLKKIMGDLHTNDNAANKIVEENEPTETDMRYRTFKNSNHNLLMSLSENQDIDSADNSAGSLKNNDKNIKDVLESSDIKARTKSEIEIKSETAIKIDNTTIKDLTDNSKTVKTDNLKDNIKTAKTEHLTDTQNIMQNIKEKSVVEGVEEKDKQDTLEPLGIKAKTKFDYDKSDKNLNKVNQIDISASNAAQSQVEQIRNIKNISDLPGVSSGSGDSVNGKIVSDIISSISSNEILASGKKSEQQTKLSNRSENDFDSIISRFDKKQSLNISDSNYSSDSSFSGQNDQNSAKSSSLGGTTNRTASSILPSYVTNQVVRSINRAFNNGDSEIRLQLRPAELGRIFMTIETQGDMLKVNVVTENQAAKDILTSNANDLKTTLANSGINIESFDVEMGSDFKQSMANSGQQQSQSDSNSGKSNNRGGIGVNLKSIEAGGAAVSNILDNEDGNLHLVA